MQDICISGQVVLKQQVGSRMSAGRTCWGWNHCLDRRIITTNTPAIPKEWPSLQLHPIGDRALGLRQSVESLEGFLESKCLWERSQVPTPTTLSASSPPGLLSDLSFTGSLFRVPLHTHATQTHHVNLCKLLTLACKYLRT